jgi:tungstate transport system substrate-binding protein
MQIQRRALLGTVAGGAVASLAGCTVFGRSDAPEASVTDEELTLATTTSTADTGLLAEVNAGFEERFSVRVASVPQGTGAALRTARDGDADVVMVHARPLEDEFLREGYGVNRRALMFNDFVVVGPADDPAGIRGGDDAAAAFTAIAEAGAVGDALFVSRGDDSGTHAKERAIWEASAGEPGGEWYVETGQGMGDTLTNANQQGGYVLADRGTYLSRRSGLNLELLLEGPIGGGDERLANPYGVVAVNPAVHPNVAYDAAMAYIGYVTSPEAQRIIEEYTVDGQQLFFPEAVSEDPRFRQYVPEGWAPEAT